MGQAISNMIRWIFSCGKSSDSHQQQNNPNETSPSPPPPPPLLPNNSNDNNNATLLQTPLSSSSRSNSFLVDSNLLDDRLSSIVIIRSSSSEYDTSVISRTTSNSQCDTEEEFVYPQSIGSVGEYWINHYCSKQRILLVGEGDFSFSACLGKAFGSAANIIATSLNSKEYLESNYSKAMSNIQSLSDRGCIVLHGVDATKMANLLLLKTIKFDRIVFNFPHAGFYLHETRQSQILRHRALVRGFLKNAKKMISENGEIHITHKSNGFFQEWKIEAIALASGLRLVQDLHFNFRDYPGYHTKYGFGGDKNFNCNPSRSYKFGLGSYISH